MLSILGGYDARDPASVNLPMPDLTDGMNDGVEGLRIGIPDNYYFDLMDDEARGLVDTAIDVLRDAGADIRTVSLPLAEHYMAVEFGLCLPEASAYHQEALRERADLFQEDVRAFLEIGEMVPATDYIKALRVREQIKQGWGALMDRDTGIDVILAPAVPTDAAAVGQENFTWADGTEESITSAYVRHAAPANVTGLPSIAVPCGFTKRNLPMGIQILGRAYEEATIVRAARTYEAATNFAQKAPDL